MNLLASEASQHVVTSLEALAVTYLGSLVMTKVYEQHTCGTTVSTNTTKLSTHSKQSRDGSSKVFQMDE